LRRDERHARLLIDAVRNALRAGVLHYAKDGRLLTTDLAIMQALVNDGEIRVVDPNANQPRGAH
jgi:hypothetical protein